jgi:hypothetical protein
VEPALTGRGIGAELVKVAKLERPTVCSSGRSHEEGAPDILYVWSGESIGG